MKKRCPRCGRLMKEKNNNLFTCRCGNAWENGKGFFQYEQLHQLNYINYNAKRKEPSVYNPGDLGAGKTEESLGNCPAYFPSEKKAEDIIRGGIYYIKKHMTEGHEQHSGRPAVVVSDVTEGDYNKIVTVVYLTSKEKPKANTRTTMTSSGIVATALGEQITCVDINRVGKFMGLASPAEMSAIKKCIAAHLGMLNESYYFSSKDDKDKLILQLQAKISALEKQLLEQTSIVESQEKIIKRY